MKKTFLALMCAAVFALPLAACGRGEGTAREPEPLPDETAEVPEEHTEPLPDETTPQNAFPQENEDPEEEPKEEKAQYICVKTDGLNVRTGAGTSYAALGTAQKNTLLPLVGREDGWLKTFYLGREAYVSSNAQYVGFFEMEKGGGTVENVIAEGLKLLGTPYVYGAVRLHDGTGRLLKNFTAKAFDCSSLMQYIFYYGAGVNLNVTTRTQASQGKEVSRNTLKRGDLLFFTNASRKNNKGLERIGHVALYLGDNYILHTASDFAKIEQISSTRWSYFVTARRV